MDIYEKIGESALLQQIAEEAAELAQAALKLARKLDGKNPTPKNERRMHRKPSGRIRRHGPRHGLMAPAPKVGV